MVDDFGLKARKPAKKPRLTPTMKVKRLGFAKKHTKWTIQQWQQVFSDESTVQQFTTRHRYVRRPTGKRFDERCTTQSMKLPPSVMIWGGMSVNGTAGLFFLPPGTTMNDQKYVDLLKDKLELHMAIHKCKIFRQDGAPCHPPKSLLSFEVEENSNPGLTWKQSKFDPIENLWTVLKDKVSEKQSASAKELVDAIKAVWVHEFSAEYCRNLVVSRPKHLEAIIKAKGGPAKYWLFWKFCVQSTGFLCINFPLLVIFTNMPSKVYYWVNMRFVV